MKNGSSIAVIGGLIGLYVAKKYGSASTGPWKIMGFEDQSMNTHVDVKLILYPNVKESLSWKAERVIKEGLKKHLKNVNHQIHSIDKVKNANEFPSYHFVVHLSFDLEPKYRFMSKSIMNRLLNFERFFNVITNIVYNENLDLKIDHWRAGLIDSGAFLVYPPKVKFEISPPFRESELRRF